VIALTLACILFVLAPWLNETPVPVLLGLSLFTVLLAVVAGVRRVWMPGAERFVVAVDGLGQWLGRGGDGSEGGRGSNGRGSGGEGSEGRGGVALATMV